MFLFSKKLLSVDCFIETSKKNNWAKNKCIKLIVILKFNIISFPKNNFLFQPMMSMKALLMFLCFVLLFQKFHGFKQINQVNIHKNEWNQTFDEHFTQLLPKTITTGIFQLNFKTTTKNFVKNEQEFNETIVKMVNLSGKILSNIQTFSGEEGQKTFRSFFNLPHAFILLESNSTNVHVKLTIYGNRGYHHHLLLHLCIKHFGPEFTYKYSGKRPPNFQLTDFIAGGFSTPVILHNTSILEISRTKFQQVVFVESLTLGKGLILDGITQYFETLNNYTNVFMKYVELISPKKILIIGGGDLIILKTIALSKHFSSIDSITLIEIDGEVVELSKKHFHQDFNSWMNNKIEIIIDDANKRVFDLEKGNIFDLIIMDVTVSIFNFISLLGSRNHDFCKFISERFLQKIVRFSHGFIF
jgi:hypothetical protein